jgi:hypothetical protein
MQIKKSYMVETCNIFPPQANKLEDSFFAEEVTDKKMFWAENMLEYFAPSSSSLEVTLSQLMATLNLSRRLFKTIF